MKKIILLLLILVSCQKSDTSSGLSGSEWIGSGQSFGSSEYYVDGKLVRNEYTTKYDYTLKFTTDNKGNLNIVSVETVNGVSEAPITRSHDFTYTYDSDFMRGVIVYDGAGGLQRPQSTFEIRSGYLYDLTGDVEYRKK